MCSSKFLRSMPGRILRVVAGLSLIVYGGMHPSLPGLVLMMVGMVPAVTGLAGICLLDEIRQRPRAGDLPPGHPRERRV